MAVSIKGTPNTSTTTSVTLPTHAVGDLIVIWAVGASSVPTKPSASGTVPAWNTPDAGVTQGALGMIWAYFVATATNHTSGTWTGAGGMVAVVINGQAASPIGGHAIAGAANSSTTATAPSITMSDTSGNSLLLEFFGTRITSSIGSPSSGYTQQASNFSTSGVGVVLDTKNTTTSDGSVTHAMSQSISNNNGGATIEILVGGTTWTGDASKAITASTSAAATRTANVDNSIAITATTTASATVNYAANASLATAASTSAAVARTANVDASLAVTASPSAGMALSGLMDASLAVTPNTSGQLTRIFFIDADLVVNANVLASTGRFVGADAALAVTAATSAGASYAGLMDASLNVGPSTFGAVSMQALINANLAVTGTPDANAGQIADANLAVTATTSAGMRRTQFVDADLVITASPHATMIIGPIDATLAVTATTTASATLFHPGTSKVGWFYLPE